MYVVQIVHDELKRQAEEKGDQAVAFLLRLWPPTEQILEVDQQIESDAAAAALFQRTESMHPLENLGEIATLLYAVSYRDQRQKTFVVLTDDRGAKIDAEARGFDWMHSGMLAVEMVGARELDYNLGRRVWESAVPRKAAARYHQEIRERHPAIAEERSGGKKQK